MEDENVIDTDKEVVKTNEEVVTEKDNSALVDKIATLTEGIQKLQERADSQSYIIGKLTNAQKKEVKEVTNTDEVNTDENKTTDVTKFTELETQVKELIESNNRKLEAVKKDKLIASLVQNGADNTNAPKFANLILVEQGKNITSTESDTGNIEVSIKSGESDVTLNDWTKMYLGSDDGRWMIGSKKGPSTKNLGSSVVNTQLTELSSRDYSAKITEINAMQITREEKKDAISKLKMI